MRRTMNTIRSHRTVAGILSATVAFGLSRPDLRDEFGAYLQDMMALQKAAQ